MMVLIQVGLQTQLGVVHVDTAKLLGSHASCSWQQLLEVA